MLYYREHGTCCIGNMVHVVSVLQCIWEHVLLQYSSRCIVRAMAVRNKAIEREIDSPT